MTAPDVAGTVFADDAPEVSRSYAEALIGAAEAEDRVEAVLDELEELVADLVVADRRFGDLLGSPALRSSDKDRILVEVFEGRALPTVVRFLRVLNRNNRLDLLAPISRQARALWDRKQNRRPVSVVSAAPLDDDQKSALSDRLARMLAATPIVQYRVDPALIGGLVVQVGDDVYDASVRTRLERLRRRLIEDKAREIQGLYDGEAAS